MDYDVVVVGGGPSGATAAEDLARAGSRVALIDKAGRIKPCGGAIPPRLIADFDIPDGQLVAKIDTARMISPTHRSVDIPIENGFVGMVDREHFDEFLRNRAAEAGATRLTGTFEEMTRDADGTVTLYYRPKDDPDSVRSIRTRLVLGADGARSAVAKQAIPGAEKMKCVFAYHEIIKSPEDGTPVPARPGSKGFDGRCCDVYYQGKLSPDFYAWIFPHGEVTSVGVGSANKGFSLRGAVKALRQDSGLDSVEVVRREGAPIPMKPLKRWDNGRDVLVTGDAAGVVAPASGEGIYYAMICGEYAADAAEAFLATGDARQLATARKRFMKAHGRVFMILGIMQRFWYVNDKRRERFVAICKDEDVQRLTWQAYMNKELVRRDPLAHIKIFLKDCAHLFGLAKAPSQG